MVERGGRSVGAGGRRGGGGCVSAARVLAVGARPASLWGPREVARMTEGAEAVAAR